MAVVQAHPYTGDLDALRSERSKSQPTPSLPSSSPVKQRASTYAPKRGGQVLEESNKDPFYLEQTLANTGDWNDSCQQPGQRDVVTREAASHQYFTLSSVNTRKDLPYPKPVQREPLRPRSHTNNYHKTNRCTLSALEIENQLSSQKVATQGLERQSVHCSKGSFSSNYSETTPDLTPSSSFSSNYSSPIHPESTRKSRDQHLSLEPQRITSDSGSHLYLTPCTPPPIRPQSALASSRLPPTPTHNSKMNSRPSKESSDRHSVMQGEEPPVRYNRLGKPLPTLPNIARNGHPKKGTPNNGNQRSPIEPSMISPPSLINPVTMEPHATHFDQAFFIPANDCPSPVPSPGPTPSPLTREWTANSPDRDKERPMTANDAHCEQSVWESDSDSESVGPKSLSKKPIDTLRKVRSRVHLRTAKSAPRLKTAPHPPPPVPPHPDGPPLEKFPSMPEQPVHRPTPPPPPPVPPKPANMKPVSRTRSRREVFRPSAQGSLRIVAPSTTSLPRPPDSRPDSRKNSQPDITEHDIDRSTAAAALQAQSRRRQRPNSPHLTPAPSFSDKEKLRTLCREEPTEHTLHSSLALGRRPLYRRFWESLRILSCHGDVPAKPTRKSV